jgi:DNA-binding NtrC family response regulator
MQDARRVLILDDDDLVGMLMETVARLDGMATRLTAQGAAFFEALDSWQPTHVVIDLTMPELSGEDVLLELARRGCTARVVIASGDDGQRMQAALALARVSALDTAGALRKPFLPAQLRALLS